MRIYPNYNDLTAGNLVSADIVPPTQIPGSKELTQLLKFNHPVDLLAISSTSALLDAGIHDMTDQIDPDVRIEKIYYSISIKGAVSGSRSVFCENVSHMSAGQFKASPASGYGNIDVNLKTPMGGGILVVKGSLNPGTGTLHVAAHNDNPNVEMIGFELEATRSNPNRRPR